MFSIYYSGLVKIADGPFKTIEKFMTYEAKHIELFMDGPWWAENGLSLAEIAKELLGYPVTFSVHAPMFDMNLASFHKEIRKESRQKAMQAIELASLIQARHVILDPGHLAVSTFDRKVTQALFFKEFTALYAYAKEKEVRLLIENSHFQGKELFREQEFIELATIFPKEFPEYAGLVLDTGHAHLMHWSVPRLLKEIAPVLGAVHLNDNDGKRDNHLAFGKGTINWIPILETLRDISYDQPLVLEYHTLTKYSSLRDSQRELVTTMAKLQKN